MNILVLSQYFWPENFRINELVKILKKRGNNVKILTGYPNYPDGKIFPNFLKNSHKYNKFYGCDVLRCPVIPRGNNLFFLTLNYLSFVITSSIYIFFFLRKKIDIIFVFGTSPPFSAIAGILLNFFKRKKIVYWLLDLWPDTFADMGIIKSQSFNWILKKIVNFIYKKCDIILCQSQKITQIVKKRYKGFTQVQYFPSWPEDYYLNYKKKKISKNKKLKILFAGNIGKVQALDKILLAIKLLEKQKNIEFIFAGKGSFYKSFINKISYYNLDKKIKYLGQVPNSKMPAIINECDALLISLKKKKVFSLTIPGKFQNYLAMKKPILAMIDGELNQLIKKNKLGFACGAENYKSLAKNIISLNKLKKKTNYKNISKL